MCPPVAIEERWDWDRRRQSYRIQGSPSEPTIFGGGPEGAMYGFYRWLRDFGGCRWPYLEQMENPVDLPPRDLPNDVMTPAIASQWKACGEAVAKRYRLWLEYVALADRAWQARRAGDEQALVATENAIQALFKRERQQLSLHLLVEWMERTSRGWAQVPCRAPSPQQA